MNNNLSLSIFNECKSTLKETSYDGANKEYMTDSLLEVIDFDKVKLQYCNLLGLEGEVPKSCDALLFLQNKTIFIEFKNGKVETFDVRKKIYDSVLIFSDLKKCTISETRKNIEYILVYNEEKNKNSKDCREFSKREIQESKSFKSISNSISKLAKKEIIRFRIGDFQNYILKDIHTYTMEEFEEKLTKIIEN